MTMVTCIVRIFVLLLFVDISITKTIKSPLKTEKTSYGTIRHFCEYQVTKEKDGPTVKILPGSTFDTLDCYHCTCTKDGLHCQGTGYYGETIMGPTKCKIVADGCRALFVLKSDNKTECYTQRPVGFQTGLIEEVTEVPVHFEPQQSAVQHSQVTNQRPFLSSFATVLNGLPQQSAVQHSQVTNQRPFLSSGATEVNGSPQNTGTQVISERRTYMQPSDALFDRVVSRQNVHLPGQLQSMSLQSKVDSTPVIMEDKVVPYMQQLIQQLPVLKQLLVNKLSQQMETGVTPQLSIPVHKESSRQSQQTIHASSPLDTRQMPQASGSRGGTRQMTFNSGPINTRQMLHTSGSRDPRQMFQATGPHVEKPASTVQSRDNAQQNAIDTSFASGPLIQTRARMSSNSQNSGAVPLIDAGSNMAMFVKTTYKNQEELDRQRQNQANIEQPLTQQRNVPLMYRGSTPDLQPGMGRQSFVNQVSPLAMSNALQAASLTDGSFIQNNPTPAFDRHMTSKVTLKRTDPTNLLMYRQSESAGASTGQIPAAHHTNFLRGATSRASMMNSPSFRQAVPTETMGDGSMAPEPFIGTNHVSGSRNQLQMFKSQPADSGATPQTKVSAVMNKDTLLGGRRSASLLNVPAQQQTRGVVQSNPYSNARSSMVMFKVPTEVEVMRKSVIDSFTSDTKSGHTDSYFPPAGRAFVSQTNAGRFQPAKQVRKNSHTSMMMFKVPAKEEVRASTPDQKDQQISQNIAGIITNGQNSYGTITEDGTPLVMFQIPVPGAIPTSIKRMSSLDSLSNVLTKESANGNVLMNLFGDQGLGNTGSSSGHFRSVSSQATSHMPPLTSQNMFKLPSPEETMADNTEQMLNYEANVDVDKLSKEGGRGGVSISTVGTVKSSPIIDRKAISSAQRKMMVFKVPSSNEA